MPVFKHVKNQTPADLPDTCEIAVYPVAVVPFALGALEYRIPKYIWSEAGYLRGVQLVRSLQMTLLCGGMEKLIESQDRIYRMLSTAIYGTSYTVFQTDPVLVVAPEIEPTHDLVIEDDDSILGRMDVMRQLLENGLNGVATEKYDRENGVRDLLEQLLVAVEASDDLDPEMLAKLVEIAAVLL